MASRRRRVAQIFSLGVGVTVTAESGPIDVHLITHEEVNRGRSRLTMTRGLTTGRRVAGLALALVGLLERALVNVLTNGLHHSPPGRAPTVTASEHGGHVEIRVIDDGPGVPATDWDRIFLPFQRLGDRDNSTGVGLGLALSRGLIEATGGSLTPDHTPGGELTMTLGLPVARDITGPGEAADRAILDRLDSWRVGEQRAATPATADQPPTRPGSEAP